PIGVDVKGGGAVVNSGSILTKNPANGVGVRLEGAGYLGNIVSSALIKGGRYGVASLAAAVGSKILNKCSIIGASGPGVKLRSSGTVTNYGGLITGQIYGVVGWRGDVGR